MAKYTTQVRSICEHYAGLEEQGDFTDIEEVIANSRAQIFTLPYPMYTGETKAALETKILRHYYTREIGLETVGLWKHFLNTRMMEIMPYYVALWNNSVNELNPSGTVDVERVIHEIGEEQGTNAGTRETETSGSKTFGRNTIRTGSIGTEDITASTRTGSVETEDTTASTKSGNIQTADQTATTKSGSVETEDTTASTKSGSVQTSDQTATTKSGSVETEDTTASTKSGNIQTADTTTTTRTGSEAVNHNTTETRTPTIETEEKYSDTPQNGLTAVKQGQYLTNYRNTSETGSEQKTTTGGDTKTYNNVADAKSGAVTETFNSVKDQKSGTVTETFNNVKDQKSGAVTETFNNVKDQKSGTVTETFNNVKDQKSGTVTETFNNVKDQKSGTVTETFNNVKDQKSGTVTETFNNVKDQEGGSDTETGSSTQTDDFSTTGNHEYTREETESGILSMKEFIDVKEKIMQLIVNIDVNIISDLSDLFMRLY